MKEIKLTRGYQTIVDDEDFERLNQFKWAAQEKHGDVYAYRRLGNGSIGIHRIIMEAPKGKVVDHINHNTLDNRRSNLRICTHAENMRNRKLQKNNKYGCPGLAYLRDRNRPWRVTIRIGEKWPKYVGVYYTQEEAVNAYKEAVKKYHGEFAWSP